MSTTIGTLDGVTTNMSSPLEDPSSAPSVSFHWTWNTVMLLGASLAGSLMLLLGLVLHYKVRICFCIYNRRKVSDVDSKEDILKRIKSSLSKVTSRKARAMLFSVDKVGETNCTICLEPLFDHGANTLGYLKKCRHIFHFDCIWKWIITDSPCPVCRTAVDPSPLSLQAVSGPALQRLAHRERAKVVTPKGTKTNNPWACFVPSKVHPIESSEILPDILMSSVSGTEETPVVVNGEVATSVAGQSATDLDVITVVYHGNNRYVTR